MTYDQFRTQLIAQERSEISNERDLSDSDVLYGRCAGFCKSFAARFPELRIARGWCLGREHYWLVKPDGEIYDPTADQFEFVPTAKNYRELNKDTDEVRVGKCMNCGSEIYGLIKKGRKDICSDECKKSFEAYLNEDKRRTVR